MQSSLESVWEYRDDVLYPSLFGVQEGGIYVLDAETFSRTFKQACDPRWLHMGVLVFPPNDQRQSWLYATSGGSTPWETEPEHYDETAYSWLGVELIIETIHKTDWVIAALHRLLAYHVLACHGRFGQRPGLDYGSLIPIGAPWGGLASELQFFGIWKATHYPATCVLPSGKFDFLHVFGLTSNERDLVKQAGMPAIVEKLRSAGGFPVTDQDRIG